MITALVLIFSSTLTTLLVTGCATIKGEIEVDLSLAEKTYISPGVAAGVQDSLVVPMSVLPTTPIAVTGYQFSVFDNRGNMGKSRPLIVVVDNLPPSLLLSVSSPIFFPKGDGKLDTLTIYQRISTKELKWSGALQNSSGGIVRDLKDESGALSANGTYSYVISSQNLAGNMFEAGLSDITLDTRKSTVLLEIEYPSFLPNGDGIRDVIRFLPKVSVTDRGRNPRNRKSWREKCINFNVTMTGYWTRSGTHRPFISWDLLMINPVRPDMSPDKPTPKPDFCLHLSAR